MKLPVFGVEDWLNTHEKSAKYDLAGVSISALTLEEIIAMGPLSQQEFFAQLAQKEMDYGWIEGSPAFKEAVSRLYQKQSPTNILQTNGATGANFLVLYALLEPGDHVVSLFPSYQQLYDIPKSLGCKVSLWEADERHDWLPDLEELQTLVCPDTKMICLNNANNPTGAVMDRTYLQEVVRIADSVGAYILADEIYTPLTEEVDFPAICDLYDRGISTNSLSKTYSIPGIRIGWVAASSEVIQILRHYRDYTMICAGVFDDFVAVYALENAATILERNRALLSTNLSLLVQWVANQAKADLVVPAFVPTSFVKLDLPMPVEDFCLQLLEKKGVLLVPGSRFGYEGYVRLGYCGPTETLNRGLEYLTEFLEEILHKNTSLD